MKKDVKLKAVEEYQHPEIQALVESIGGEATLKVVETFGGCMILIPKLESIVKKARNEQIYNDFINKMPFSQIAIKYNLSTNTVRGIIDEQRKLIGRLK